MTNAVTADTVELMLTDSQRFALEHAFEDARECLECDGAMVPFSIMCTSDGFEVLEHPGSDSADVYRSVRAAVAEEMPEGYVLSYDGFVELDDGRRDALLCEVARRGDAEATLVAQLYEKTEAGLVFAPGFVCVGSTAQLYPSGTKPIISGLVTLNAKQRERAHKKINTGEE